MGSMFNAVAGFSPTAQTALILLDIFSKTQLEAEVPRFRDAFIDPDKMVVVLMTRTGGGNRAEYAEANEALTKRPGFIRDYDDDFDSTFAYWEYELNEEAKLTLEKRIAETRDDPRMEGFFERPMDRFKRLVEEMGKA